MESPPDARWRERLNVDPAPLAQAARDALNAEWSMRPSYYADPGDEYAHQLSRDQAAEALAAWRVAG